ncbi:hypothetical protein F5B20DRAFT_597160 [Whalleya microplaca]|nr:hypothetical protein F5B20DRAFT_597160 [Whalleya microplaca]
MPYKQDGAPASIPAAETVESLLGEVNQNNKKRSKVKTLNELDPIEKQPSGLVRLGKRSAVIQGDPYGVYPYWAGNVGHPDDERINSLIGPICEKLVERQKVDNEETGRISQLLKDVSTSDLENLSQRFANNGEYTLVKNGAKELIVTFLLYSKTVRLMQAKDLNKNVCRSYDNADRAKASEERAENLLNEGTMPVSSQQYIMASVMRENKESVLHGNNSLKYLTRLRQMAQERYWLRMTREERKQVRDKADKPDESIAKSLQAIKDTWTKLWTNNPRDPDYFRQYLVDQVGAEQVWTLVDEDIFIVTDPNRQVIFANIENLTQILFGDDVADLLARCLDLWSFFTPLPAPESKRHVLDAYIRRLHPELDMTKATVENLPNAKMCVAHYGSWARCGDRDGRNIYLSRDTKFNRSEDLDLSQEMFPLFYKAAFGKAARLIEFLMKPLDPLYYTQCREIFDHLPKTRKVSTGQDDFISLFALGVNGYTQRHRDTNDIAAGLAGLVSLGNYTGGNLCIPQLGCKVPYKPGTCAIIRGDGLDHLVSDYSGPRFFMIGTNHESCKRFAFRAMGRSPPLSNKRQHPAEGGLESSTEDQTVPCVNKGADEFDDDIEFTNKWLHGPGALDFFESSSSSKSCRDTDRIKVWQEGVSRESEGKNVENDVENDAENE